MWPTEHKIGTTASAETIWRLWADVPRWPGWIADTSQIGYAVDSRGFRQRDRVAAQRRHQRGWQADPPESVRLGVGAVCAEVVLPVDDSAFVGDDDELDPVAGSELEQDSRHVGLGCKWTELEALSYFGVGEPARNQAEYLALAACEIVEPVVIGAHGRLRSGGVR